MFCNQCEEAIGGKSCTVSGACGKSADVSDLQDELIYLIKQVAKSGPKNKETDVFLMESLFATITNANFDEQYFKEKIDIANSYLDSVPDVQQEQNNDIKSLKDLTLYGLKGLAAYLHHAYTLGYEEQEIFDFIRSALSDLLDEKTVEELTTLTLKTGEFGVKTMALLDKANTEKFGSPIITKVNLSIRKNPGILVSGHDLKDLKELLEQTKDSGVDVYTHGEMLPAHAYPELKKYENLVGNYGGSWWKQKDEFERFNGPVLMTTNCLVPPKESYKNKVFTTGVAGFDGIAHIPDGNPKDFSKIIELAKLCPLPEKLEEGAITIGFAHSATLALAEKIIDAVKSGAIKRFVVMAGCDGRDKKREYYENFAKNLSKDTIILTAGCAKFRYNKLDLGDIDGIPRVIDAGQCNDSYSLVVVALKLAEVFGAKSVNDLPIVYNIAWYEQKAVLVLLALLHLGIKNIKLGPKLPAFVSPNVLNVLENKFKISGITNVEDDLEVMI